MFPDAGVNSVCHKLLLITHHLLKADKLCCLQLVQIPFLCCLFTVVAVVWGLSTALIKNASEPHFTSNRKHFGRLKTGGQTAQRPAETTHESG